jgi:hypothetical protein
MPLHHSEEEVDPWVSSLVLYDMDYHKLVWRNNPTFLLLLNMLSAMGVDIYVSV